MTITIFSFLFLLGIITGFYSGLLGTGGNIILIPALDILLTYYHIEGNELVKFVIAHSLFITMFIGFSVSYKQYKINNFHFRQVLLIGIPGMLTSYIVSEIIKTTTWYNKFYFDIVFFIMLLLLAIRLLLIKSKEENSVALSNDQRNSISFLGLGALTGGVTSLSGVGGGVIIIPFLTDILKISIKKASSISIGVIMLLASSVSFSYLSVEDGHQITKVLPLQVGYISISLVLPIIGGIFLASPFGVKKAQKTSAQKLRIIFGVVVTLLCIKTALNIFL
jgi:uncharacterized membrane protein YfcA